MLWTSRCPATDTPAGLVSLQSRRSRNRQISLSMIPSNQKTAFARGLFGALIGGLLVAPSRAESAKVSAARAPGGGIQPQAVVDAQGVVHLIYFKGKSQGGDIF